MALENTQRRWRWAVIASAAAVVVGVGYGSYSLYTSEAWKRRRQQMARLVRALSLLGDAAHEGVESAALVSGDLKRFLLSDDDELPCSLRQALKIAHSPDLQHSCTVLSAALTRGLLRGFYSSHAPTRNRDRFNTPLEDPVCKEIKEICLISSSKSPGSHKRGGFNESEGDQQHHLNSATLGPTRIVSPSGSDERRQQRGSSQSEDLSDRLLGKLFSEPGVNFVSAVAGSLARNSVKALFEGFESQTMSSLYGGDKTDSGEERTGNSKVVDVLCTQQCRGLIAECIQTLVTTAVSVYVEKTKDINFYDDMVAGITNPSHRDPMKELLTSVSNGAIETLVKTSHSVMFAKHLGQLASDSRQLCPGQQEPWAVEVQNQLCVGTPLLSISRNIQCQGTLEHGDTHLCERSSSTDRCDISMPILRGQVNGGTVQDDTQIEACGENRRPDSGGVQSFIEGVSKTLAIPSNHKLVVDVAGTMTSEAIRSFVDVIISTVSNSVHDKLKRGWRIMKLDASEQKSGNLALQCQNKSNGATIKAFILASVCLAICLHMLTGVHFAARA